ncbi:MAG TPA: FeoA family protein [Treponemataceae bacterium]|nr:FeoA family protein [Treponemataceae bacterium]
MNLANLKPGQKGRISSVGGSGALRRHLLDMGLTPGTPVLVRKVAPMGDPIEVCLRRYELTLRREEAEKIEILEESVWVPVGGSCRSCKKNRACNSGKRGFWGKNRKRGGFGRRGGHNE